MPWNDYFNNVLGGAAGGMFRAGRGASLAEILAGAAMGSTAAMEYEDEKARRLQEIEERRAQEEEDRAYRLEQREAQRREQEARLKASESLASYVGQFEPGFTGPIREEIPMSAFPTPEGQLNYLQQKQSHESEQESLSADVQFLLENNISVPSRPDEVKRFASRLREDLAFPKEEKPDFTPEQLYQHGRDAQQDQEEEDDAWREQFTDDLNASRFDKREGPAIKAWDEAFKRNLTLVKGNDSTKGLAPDDLIEEAKRLTDEEVGFNKGGLVGSSMPNLGRPKAPPINKQPLPDTLTGLRPSGSPVASPTGAQAPPSANRNADRDASQQIQSMLKNAVPGAPEAIRGPALMQIYNETKNLTGEAKRRRIQELVQEYKQDAAGIQFPSIP